MNLTEFTVRLLFLLFPGIVSWLIVEVLTGSKQNNWFRFFINCFVLSTVCYLIYGLFSGDTQFIQSIQSSTSTIHYSEVITATIISIPVAFVVCFCISLNVFNALGIYLNITNNLGNGSVWKHVLSQHYRWITVRDIKNGLVYEGYLIAYSEKDGPNELFMIDVNVYNNDSGKLLYHVESIYLSRSNDDLTIESSEPFLSNRLDKTRILEFSVKGLFKMRKPKLVNQDRIDSRKIKK